MRETLDESLKIMKRNLNSVDIDDDVEEIFLEIERAKKGVDEKRK